MDQIRSLISKNPHHLHPWSMISIIISQYSFVIWIVKNIMIDSVWPFIPVKIWTCILQKMLISGSRKNQPAHLISSLLGISLVVYFFRYSAIYLILLTINTWTALQIARKHRCQSQGMKNLFFTTFSPFFKHFWSFRKHHKCHLFHLWILNEVLYQTSWRIFWNANGDNHENHIDCLRSRKEKIIA